MIERILLIFWCLWVLMLLLAACRVFGFLVARRMQDRRWGDGRRNQQAVALILPVKGFDQHSTPKFFDSIFGQDYENFRVIVCFESWDDPIAVWLSEHLEVRAAQPVWSHPDKTSGLRSITLVCAGISNDEGQKVHNQIAAFKVLSGDDAVIAFADADIICGATWLAKLVAPINQATHSLSTTYRWLVPKRPTFPNQIASVINGSITTQGGNDLTNVLWGGSMAISREVFDAMDVSGLFAGSLNDDLRLSKAARRAGHKIAFVRSLIIPTMIDFTWRTFFEFARRQYTQVKFFSPILYSGINVVLGFYIIGAASIVAALVYGYFYAWIPVAAAYVIDQFRALARQQVYLSLFPDPRVRHKLFAASWLEHMLTPFWIALHWLLLASTWTQNRITWGGIRYRIHSSSKTQVLHRPIETERIPAGIPGPAMLRALHDPIRTETTRASLPLPKVTTKVPVTSVAAEKDILKTPVANVLSGVPSRAPHPQGPSAVIPLTTAFYDRRIRSREVIQARERGRFSAAEIALTKTRVESPVFHPVPRPPLPLPCSVRKAHPFVGESPRSILSSVDILLAKTRLDGAERPRDFFEDSPHRAPLVSRGEWLTTKTRVKVSRSYPIPPRPNPVNPPHAAPGSPFAFPIPRSLAARRAHFSRGCLIARCGSSALSGRVGQGGRVGGAVLSARPGTHRPSGRP